MAASGGSDLIRSLVSLSSISALESSTAWIKWNREIRDYLIMAGFGDLLTRQATSPPQDSLTVDAWTTKKELWTEKEERACAAIRNRLGYNARSAVENLTTVSTILAKIKSVRS